MITPEKRASCGAATQQQSFAPGTVDPWSCRLPESGEVFSATQTWTITLRPQKKKPPRGRLGDSAICRGKRRSESRVAPNILPEKSKFDGAP